MTVSRKTLRWLAAAVWYIGGFMLLYKGAGYVLDAAAARPASPVPWLGGAIGASIGALRGRRTFARGCRKNLARIDALEEPRPWQFFRGRFFIALGAMIAAGIALRWIAAAGGYGAALVVGSLELVIALALLTSSVEFWAWRGVSSAGAPGSPQPAPAPSRSTRSY